MRIVPLVVLSLLVAPGLVAAIDAPAPSRPLETPDAACVLWPCAAPAEPEAASPAAGDACAGGGDAPGEPPGVAVATPARCEGVLGEYEFDVYRVTATAGSVLHILAEASLSLEVLFRDADGAWRWWYGSPEHPVRATVAAPPGPVDVFVRSYEGEVLPYVLSLWETPRATSPDCGTDADTPHVLDDVATTATLTQAGCRFVLDPGDVGDTARFVADPDKAYRVEMSAPAGLVGLAVLWRDGASLDDWPYLVTVFDATGHASVDLVDTGVGGAWIAAIVLGDGLNGTRAVDVSLAVVPPPASNDCGLLTDLPALAPTYVLGATRCEGDLVPGDTGDAFRLEIPDGPVRLELALAGQAYGLLDTRVVYPTTSALYIEPEDPRPSTLRVWNAWGEAAGGAYNVSAAATIDPQDDCRLGRDATRHATRAVTIEGPFTCDGMLEGTDMLDLYRNVGAGEEFVEVRAYGLGYWDALEVRDDEGTLLGSSYPGASTVGLRTDVPIVIGLQEWDARYTLHVIRASVDLADDCGSGHDADAAREGSVRLVAPADCAAQLTTRGDVNDTYVFHADAGDYIAVRLAAQRVLAMDLIAPDGTRTTYPTLLHTATDIAARHAHLGGDWTLVVRERRASDGGLLDYGFQLWTLPRGLLRVG